VIHWRDVRRGRLAEYLPREMPRPTSKPPRDHDRALVLDLSCIPGDRILRRNAQTHLHMIRHQKPFHYRRFAVTRQFPKHLMQLPPQRSKQILLAAVSNKYTMVFAIPPRMRKTLVLLLGLAFLSWSRVGAPR